MEQGRDLTKSVQIPLKDEIGTVHDKQGLDFTRFYWGMD
jgi:hypothetical protein